MRIIALTTILFIFSTNVVFAFDANTDSTDLELSSSQYWSIDDATQVGLDISGDFTISAWVNFESFSASAMTVVAKSNTAAESTGAYNFFMFDDANPSPHIRFSTNISNGTSFGSVNRYWTSQPSTATWYFVTMTYTASSGNVSFWVDGVEQSTAQASGITSVNNNAQAFRIGASNNGGSASTFWDGQIDDVRIWSRVLTGTEIGDLYDTPCTFDNGASIQGQWLFDATGDDETANTNDLTNNNSATFTTEAYTCPAASTPSDDTTFDILGVARSFLVLLIAPPLRKNRGKITV